MSEEANELYRSGNLSTTNKQQGVLQSATHHVGHAHHHGPHAHHSGGHASRPAQGQRTEARAHNPSGHHVGENGSRSGHSSRSTSGAGSPLLSRRSPHALGPIGMTALHPLGEGSNPPSSFTTSGIATPAGNGGPGAGTFTVPGLPAGPAGGPYPQGMPGLPGFNPMALARMHADGISPPFTSASSSTPNQGLGLDDLSLGSLLLPPASAPPNQPPSSLVSQAGSTSKVNANANANTTSTGTDTNTGANTTTNTNTDTNPNVGTSGNTINKASAGNNNTGSASEEAQWRALFESSALPLARSPVESPQFPRSGDSPGSSARSGRNSFTSGPVSDPSSVATSAPASGEPKSEQEPKTEQDSKPDLVPPGASLSHDQESNTQADALLRSLGVNDDILFGDAGNDQETEPWNRFSFLEPGSKRPPPQAQENQGSSIAGTPQSQAPGGAASQAGQDRQGRDQQGDPGIQGPTHTFPPFELDLSAFNPSQS